VKPGQDCYRVPMTRGEKRLVVVITAYSAQDAMDRAAVMAEDVFMRRFPWMFSRRKPTVDLHVPIVIEQPVLLHVRGLHR
jgi:hypothetical protein